MNSAEPADAAAIVAAHPRSTIPPRVQGLPPERVTRPHTADTAATARTRVIIFTWLDFLLHNVLSGFVPLLNDGRTHEVQIVLREPPLR